MNHESLSIPEDSEVWCELEERQYQKFKARLIKELRAKKEACEACDEYGNLHYQDAVLISLVDASGC